MSATPSTKKATAKKPPAKKAKKTAKKTPAKTPGKAKSTAKTSPAKKVKKKTATPDAKKTARPVKANRPPETGKLSCRAAALQVLRDAGKPMTVPELVAEMSRRGLWTSPAGKTPDRTLSSRMLERPNQFRRVSRGLFEAVAESPAPSA